MNDHSNKTISEQIADAQKKLLELTKHFLGNYQPFQGSEGSGSRRKRLDTCYLHLLVHLDSCGRLQRQLGVDRNHPDIPNRYRQLSPLISQLEGGSGKQAHGVKGVLINSGYIKAASIDSSKGNDQVLYLSDSGQVAIQNVLDAWYPLLRRMESAYELHASCEELGRLLWKLRGAISVKPNIRLEPYESMGPNMEERLWGDVHEALGMLRRPEMDLEVILLGLLVSSPSLASELTTAEQGRLSLALKSLSVVFQQAQSGELPQAFAQKSAEVLLYLKAIRDQIRSDPTVSEPARTKLLELMQRLLH